MRSNNLYIIIAGHNGAGKSTFLKEFIRHKNLKYIDADEIAQALSDLKERRVR